MITGQQIRAARGLLDWTQTDLAKHCGLTASAIKNIESNPEVRPHAKSIEALVDVFRRHGVAFTPRGVELSDNHVRLLEGDNAYLQMLDDAFYALKDGGEMLFMCSSDIHSVPGEAEAEQRLRETGIRFRSLIEEGKPNTIYPAREYRVIPKQYWAHSLQVIYADKVAQVLDSRKILLIEDPVFAAMQRNSFNLIWSFLKPFNSTGD